MNDAINETCNSKSSTCHSYHSKVVRHYYKHNKVRISFRNELKSRVKNMANNHCGNHLLWTFLFNLWILKFRFVNMVIITTLLCLLLSILYDPPDKRDSLNYDCEKHDKEQTSNVRSFFIASPFLKQYPIHMRSEIYA